MRVGVVILLSFFCCIAAGRAVEYADPVVDAGTAELLQEVYALAETNAPAALVLLEQDYDAEKSAAVIDYALGSLFFSEQDYGKALQFYERAVAKVPEFKRAIRDLGRVHLANGQAERTVEIYRDLVSSGNGDAQILNVLGYAHVMNADFVSGAAAFNQVLLFEPDNRQALMGLGQCLLSMDRYDEAYALFEPMTRKRPFEESLWDIKARAALAAGREKQSAVELETARRLGAEDENLLMLLGDVYLSRQLPNLAMEIYNQLGSMTNLPDRAVAAVRTLLAMQEYEQAVHLIASVEANSGDELDPGVLDRLKGDLAFGQEDYAKAETWYRSYLEVEPLDGAVLLLLGDCMNRTEQREAALIQYERAQRVAGMEADALVRQANVAIERNQYERALELLEKAQSYDQQAYVEKFLRQLRNLVGSP